MMSFLARLLTLVLAIWAMLRLVRFFRRSTDQAQARTSDRRAGGRALSGGRMVRDRVCGTHVPEDRAITLREEGRTFYFCGTRCRDAHLQSARGPEAGS